MAEDNVIPAAGLTVLIDPAVPESQLALAPTRALIAELGLLATWLPVRSELPKASARRTETEFQARRRRAREQNARRERERYYTGLVDAPAGDADVPRAALYWVHGRGDGGAFCESLLRSVWVDGVALDQAARDALAELGLEDGFAEFLVDSDQSLEALEAEITEQGLYRGPAYIIDGEPFQGRAHLPLMRWRLTGEVGPPPV